jgi:quercetin dioxygenase-like cupin family protein
MSTIHRYNGEENNFSWDGSAILSYDDPSVKGVSGERIIGDHDGKPNYYFRYFHVEPGGYTFLHQHAHDHGIMILHGQATVVTEGQEYEVGPRDVVYISPNEMHQVRALGDEPLGFLCVIDPKAMKG